MNGISLLIINIVIFVLLYFLISFFLENIKMIKIHKYFKRNVVVNKNIYKDVSNSMLATFNTDNINTLKDFFYDIFYNFEKAYNNLDYNMMQILSTKQLYNNYYTGIVLDLQVGKKKIINDIKRKNVIIYGLDSTVARQTACVMIEISYITYTLNKKGRVISGSRCDTVTEKFDVTFVKLFDRQELTKCPTCGASIVGNKCEYCRTVLKNEEFRISNIKKIID